MLLRLNYEVVSNAIGGRGTQPITQARNYNIFAEASVNKLDEPWPNKAERNFVNSGLQNTQTGRLLP
jgi:hypothetical protein